VSTTSVTPSPEEELPATTDSIFRARLRHYRQGDTGMVPIIIGMVILGGYFQLRSSAFLSAGTSRIFLSNRHRSFCWNG